MKKILEQIINQSSLLHDFGKTGNFLQNKLIKNRRIADPIRHEVLSVLLSSYIDKEKNIKDAFKKIIPLQKESKFPLKTPVSIQDVINWIIATHHRLPAQPAGGGYNCENHVALISTQKDMKSCLTYSSKKSADLFADSDFNNKFLDIINNIENGDNSYNSDNPLTNPQIEALFIYGRLALIMSDHFSSAQELESGVTGLFANSESNGRKSQDLAKHLLAVEKNSVEAIDVLLEIGNKLPFLSMNDINVLTTESPLLYDWQNKAVKKAKEVSIEIESAQSGMFAVVCASTGSGKTRGCAKIIAAVNGNNQLRFATLLGLRNLTLQTGFAYSEELGIPNSQVSVLIGSQEVRLLNERHKTMQTNKDEMDYLKDGLGSVDNDELEEDDYYSDIKVENDKNHNSAYDFILNKKNIGVPPIIDFFANSEDKKKLIAAPVLVCTIDYLVKAGDWRKAYHVLAQLRLASSDIIIDEVDSYNLNDYPAIARLCYLVGMFGRKLILSSATIMPELASPLYAAYAAGWEAYAALNGRDNKIHSLFVSDSIDPVSFCYEDNTGFTKAYSDYAALVGEVVLQKTIENPTHRCSISNIINPKGFIDSVINLHKMNHVMSDDIAVSAGMIRLSRVRDVVYVANAIAVRAEKINKIHGINIKVIVYHSKMPGAIRSWLENKIDCALKRHPNKPDSLLSSDIAVPVIEETRALGLKDTIIIVVTSPIEEVGRDHDFDWLILELSSTRSAIQCIGRVNRHRRLLLKEGQHNIVILERNGRALEGQPVVFHRPGFETEEDTFHSHNTSELIPNLCNYPCAASCLLKLDSDSIDIMAVWERRIINDFLERTIGKEFIYGLAPKISTKHMKKYEFRQKSKTVEIYYNLVEKKWKRPVNAIGIGYKKEVIYINLNSVSHKKMLSIGWFISDKELLPIASKIADLVGLDVYSDEFSEKYMRLPVLESEILRLEGSPVMGLFSGEVSVFCQKTE